MSKNRLVSGTGQRVSSCHARYALILQLIFVYFAPYYLFGVSFGPFCRGYHRLRYLFAEYFAEIYRGGIEYDSSGKYEAAKVLGFTKRQTFFRIILPQVIKRIVPSTANEVITLVKVTRSTRPLVVAELFRVAQIASARQFSTMPIFIAGVFYFVMNWGVSAIFDRVEKKLSYYR
jgi:polar amino acid transport system permease protein